MMNSNGVGRLVKDGKFYTNIDLLFFVVLLILKLVVHSSAQQTDEVADIVNETPLKVGLGHGTQYNIIDKVHEVLIIDRVKHEGYPIAMYKEEFVIEDFDPNRHKTFKKKKNIPRHQHQNTIEHYNAMKLEKIYFDILPQRPILKSEDKEANDAKFVAELVPLVTKNTNLVSKKDILSNDIKQFPRRRKRDIVESRAKEYELENQNPFYYMNNKVSNHYSSQASQDLFNIMQPQFYQNSKPNFVRHPMQGYPWGQKSMLRQQEKPFPGNTDQFLATTTLDTPRGTSPPSLWHDSNPENFDFSQYDNPKPNVVTDRPTGSQNDGTDPFPAATPPTRKVSNCIWAINNCCSETDNKINYNCFEEFNCHGAFWDVNPCSDKVRDSAILHVHRVYAQAPYINW